MRLPVTLCALALLLSSQGCQTMEAHIMAHQAVMGLHGLKSYRGTVTERGILRDAPETLVVKQITYSRLWKVRAEVKAPEDHAGELFVFDGSTLSLWWPRYYFGLRIRGIELPSKQEIDQTILDSCVWAVENYDYSNQGTTRMRGRGVREWLGEPREARPFRYPYRAWLDGQFNVPLKVRVEKDPGRAWYEMALGPVQFGVEVPPETFAFEFPEDATIHDWDLQAPGVSLEEAQAAVQFPLFVPGRLPEGHRIRKVVLSRNQETPMAALIMNRGATWLSLSQLPNMGPIMVPELGIPVQVGEAEGVLNFVLGFSVLSWSRGTTALTLIGNLPHPELIAIAADLRPAQPKESK